MLRAVLLSSLLFASLVAGCADEQEPAPIEPVAAAHAPFVDAAGDAPAVLDLVGGRLVETPETLVVEIQVAGLDPSTLAADLASAGHSGAWIEMCWDNEASEGDEPAECAGVALSVGDGGSAIGYYEAFHGPSAGCNDWWWCSWRVPHQIVPGSPATLQVSIPRDLMANASLGVGLAGLDLTSWAQPQDAVGREATVWACPVVTCVNQGVGGTPWRLEVDDAGAGADFRYSLPAEASAHSPTGPLLIDPAGDIANDLEGPRPDLDIVAVDLEVTGTELAFVVSVADLGELPTHTFDMELGIGPFVYMAWYDVVAGQVVRPGSGYCKGSCETWVELPIGVRFAAGTPGTIRVSWSLADLALGDDRRVNLAEAELADLVVTTFSPNAPVPSFVHVFAGGATWDTASYASPYRVLDGPATTA